MKSERQAIKKVLVRNIKRYRKRAGLTQEEAAERADVTGKYWQRLEMASQIDLPSLPILFRIAKTLRIAPHRLLKE